MMGFRQNIRQKKIFYGIMFLYILIPLSIFLGWIPYEMRYYAMTFLLMAISLYAISESFDKKNLGFRWDNFKKAFFLHAIISLPLIISSVILVRIFETVRTLEAPESLGFYIMYLTISGPVQEWLYRAVPFAAIKKHTQWNKNIQILVLSFNFAWLHIIYHDWIIYLASLIMGTIWTIIYTRYPNYGAIAIVHALVGFIAIWFGII